MLLECEARAARTSRKETPPPQNVRGHVDKCVLTFRYVAASPVASPKRPQVRSRFASPSALDVRDPEAEQALGQHLASVRPGCQDGRPDAGGLLPTRMHMAASGAQCAHKVLCTSYSSLSRKAVGRLWGTHGSPAPRSLRVILPCLAYETTKCMAGRLRTLQVVYEICPALVSPSM